MPVICKVCNKIFGFRKNLNRHVREVHQMEMETTVVSYDCTVHNSKCLEEGCNSSFRNIQDLRNHLQDTHNVTFPKEELQFEHFDEFRTWLLNISNSDNVRYLKNNTRRSSSSNSETIYFFCNRGRQTSKMLPPDAIRKRKLKRQGTCKTGVACTSTIRVTRCLRTNNCSVLFFKTHYGHTLDLQHIRLLPVDRITVATKLASGVTASRILRANRENIGATPLKRVDMLTREDLKNVKKSFNIDINEGVHHENDVMSVDLWISDLMKTDRSVVMYKKQGDIKPIIPGNYENKKFHGNDFISSSAKCSTNKNVISAKLIKQKCQDILALNLDSSDSNALGHVVKQLNNVYNLLSQSNNNKIIVDKPNSFKHRLDGVDGEVNNNNSSNEPANKKIEKQLQFVSTKRKRISKKEEFGKPNGTEISEIKGFLHSKQVLHISMDSAADHNYFNSTV